ncbi:DUF4124 domain-containing protein [Halopseudomonas bauzanensis]|uniref:DUF4124 domain-containing protein n=1 Tax=Halopseudomonas bauzanensis TaxID=653930 RepID=UPI003305D632
MALKPCPDCGTSVSSSAITCPKCGRNLAAYRSHWWALAILAVMVAAADFSLSTPAQAQQIYRCVGLDGHTTFSQQACPGGVTGEEVSAHNAPPSNGRDHIPYGDTSVLPPPRERTASRVNVVGGGHRCSNLSSQEIRTATVQKRALIGMTTTQMVKALGPPLRVNTSSHGSTQWVYPGRLYIYTEGGCVVSWN